MTQSHIYLTKSHAGTTGGDRYSLPKWNGWGGAPRSSRVSWRKGSKEILGYQFNYIY
jgi:hypothetical protein